MPLFLQPFFFDIDKSSIAQQSLEAKERDSEREDVNKELDRQNKIEVALIQADSKSEALESSKEDATDGQDKLTLEREKMRDKKDTEEKKLRMMDEKNKEDLKSKRYIEDKKLSMMKDKNKEDLRIKEKQLKVKAAVRKAKK